MRKYIAVVLCEFRLRYNEIYSILSSDPHVPSTKIVYHNRGNPSPDKDARDRFDITDKIQL